MKLPHKIVGTQQEVCKHWKQGIVICEVDSFVYGIDDNNNKKAANFFFNSNVPGVSLRIISGLSHYILVETLCKWQWSSPVLYATVVKTNMSMTCPCSYNGPQSHIMPPFFIKQIQGISQMKLDISDFFRGKNISQLPSMKLGIPSQVLLWPSVSTNVLA